jgi:ribulose-5-phosphate 4-epimerase/fuculose-1-phosphate aldolase
VTTGDLREVIVRAAHTTARLGLVTAFGHVSARDGDTMVITPVAALGEIGPDGLLVVPVDVTELPTATPAEAWLHLQVYRRRPDVRAIVRGQPQETYAVGAVTDLVEPLHGQASWLGRRVPVHPGTRLLRSAELAAAAAESLGARTPWCCAETARWPPVPPPARRLPAVVAGHDVPHLDPGPPGR